MINSHKCKDNLKFIEWSIFGCIVCKRLYIKRDNKLRRMSGFMGNFPATAIVNYHG
jgi:hypothetical protein